MLFFVRIYGRRILLCHLFFLYITFDLITFPPPSDAEWYYNSFFCWCAMIEIIYNLYALVGNLYLQSQTSKHFFRFSFISGKCKFSLFVLCILPRLRLFHSLTWRGQYLRLILCSFTYVSADISCHWVEWRRYVCPDRPRMLFRRSVLRFLKIYWALECSVN